MKRRAGIGITLALTTAMCGERSDCNEQVLEVMAPPTVVFYRFLMASIGLGAILRSKANCRRCKFSQAALAVCSRLPPAVCRNFILFSSSCNTSARRFSGHRPAIAGRDDGG